MLNPCRKRVNWSEIYTKRYESLTCRPLAEAGVGFVNSLALDAVEHRFLLCGVADSSISLYDLQGVGSLDNPEDRLLDPVVKIERRQGHEYGVTKVQWWPKDNGLFLSSSFDKTLKAWETSSLEEIYSFDLEHKIYNFDINARSAVTAVGMDHPFICLVDLNSASTSHTLRGHSGAILSVKWSPQHKDLLASAGSDGTVRIWDIRQSQPMIASMDLMHTAGHPMAPLRFRRAHRGSVNGLCWFDDGSHLCSLGNDNKARLWDLTTGGGLNSGINYGPLIHNSFKQTCDPVLSPNGEPQNMLLFIPTDDGHILMYEALTGNFARKLRPAKLSNKRQACLEMRRKNTCGVLSGDGAGSINLWRPGREMRRQREPSALCDAEASSEKKPGATLYDYL